MATRPTQIVTNKVRLSYAHLFKPYAHNPGQEPKYSVTILVPKTDTATKANIDRAIEAAKQEGITNKWGGQLPPVVKIPVHDGDGARQNGQPFGDECKGHWVLTASSKQAPAVVDQAVQPILDQNEVYSGMYARVSINFFAYSSSGSIGIGAGLNNVQKLADGEPLGGRTSAAEDFGAPVAQPVQQQSANTYAQATQNAFGAPQQAAPAIDPITGMPLAPGV